MKTPESWSPHFSFGGLLLRDFTAHSFSSVTWDLYRTTLSLIDEFMGMVDRWTYETRYHSYRVTRISLLLGEQMGLRPDELFVLGAGALLHDIGKLRIPQGILLKRDGLTEEDLSLLRLHPELGGNILNRFPSLHFARDLIVQHAERWNGCGYPKGLRGERIARDARIFAVADRYDFLTGNRSCQDPVVHEEALLDLELGVGVLYDPEVVTHFFGIPKERLQDTFVPFEEEGNLEGLFPPDRFLRLFVA